MKTALIVYWSKTGNTEKVDNTIKQGLEEAKVEVTLKRPEEAENLDYFAYDLVCVGCPSYNWHTPEPMARFLKKKFDFYRENGKVRLGAPQVDGKRAVVFVTYSGPHTGIDEATPVGKDIGQYFEHIGIHVVAEWYVLSEFHGAKEPNREGRLGDLRGKPDAEQLQNIKDKASQILLKIP
ncbi:MAG TPA: flavodoxin domain-containing protein [Candidatus Acidoferrales bacterium]|nr:flavodoxin domain-containing protein [Candidatus Acidoferrales bacterium]